MKRRLFWKFLLIIATGIVALFYLVDDFSSRTEKNMSSLAVEHKAELRSWARRAESYYLAGDTSGLQAWLNEIESREKTKASIVKYSYEVVAGNLLDRKHYTEHNFGRNVDWPIHLSFQRNPLMEVHFQQDQVSFLIALPDRMRPGSHWPTMRFVLQVLIPMILLALLAVLLYRHIMQPLGKLERATQDFSRGDLSVRVSDRLGRRNDELSRLATTFDQMATRIGELIVSQRQLIADLSHELRTPLTRLDMAIANAKADLSDSGSFDRIERESRHIRRLVEDTLTLAWLENERPELPPENLDLVDLMDVILDDAKFEFPDRTIKAEMPDSATIGGSNHRAVGQALENMLRNALRFSPPGEAVEVRLWGVEGAYRIEIGDRGPGVPEDLLEAIFQPFFRIDKSRAADSSSFGLGLALARRNLAAVGGSANAVNRENGGLAVTVTLPKQ